MSNGKAVTIRLIVGLIKKYCYIKMTYFPPFGNSKNETKFDLDLPNYATKSHLKTQQVSMHLHLRLKMI